MHQKTLFRQHSSGGDNQLLFLYLFFPQRIHIFKNLSGVNIILQNKFTLLIF